MGTSEKRVRERNKLMAQIAALESKLADMQAALEQEKIDRAAAFAEIQTTVNEAREMMRSNRASVAKVAAALGKVRKAHAEVREPPHSRHLALVPGLTGSPPRSSRARWTRVSPACRAARRAATPARWQRCAAWRRSSSASSPMRAPSSLAKRRHLATRRSPRTLAPPASPRRLVAQVRGSAIASVQADLMRGLQEVREQVAFALSSTAQDATATTLGQAPRRLAAPRPRPWPFAPTPLPPSPRRSPA